ncbi:predicted protein [Naegleria gruberi]|uniref:Predicted protein n=1 Tax=Naegleria gruberi TaxID=5762 RepID=D2VJH7_NAEGR|nr:uncharacterized protein NAEGRDRAFT_69042 [Naegleria gruberi]EFC42946.1 predicted protein [Naegleria gruberi]|eukprot:XP_002675690.1 predicted protein [Naegleria gruberi strain NEG-M]
MGQSLAAEHSHLFLAPPTSISYPIPFQSRDDFTQDAHQFRIDFHSVSHEDYQRSFSTKGFYVRSCVNFMNKEEQIQQCRTELQDEIAKLLDDHDKKNNSEFTTREQRVMTKIVEREINLASNRLIQSSEAFATIPLQRVVDNYYIEFEKQVIKPLEGLEQGFEKCFVLFYETLWKQVVVNRSFDEGNNEKVNTDGQEEVYFDIGMKITERGNHVEISYWSLMDYHGTCERKLTIPYDLKNMASIFKELLVREDKERVEPISVFNFLFKMSLLIEKIKFLTLVDQCKSKDSILLKSICINRCFLDRDTILNVDEERDLTDEENDIIFQNSVERFEIQREKTIEKIVSEHLGKIKIKDEGINLVCKKGIIEKKREELTEEFLGNERLFINNELILHSQPVKEIPLTEKIPPQYLFEPIEIPKEKRQEKFVDFVYKTRGFKVQSDQLLDDMRFSKIIDRNTVKREKKAEVPNFNLPVTPKTSQDNGVIARTASTLISEYLRNVSLRNFAFEQYKNDRLSIMQNRLGNVGGRDHFTTLLIRRMRNRLKYLLAQPNHKVSTEKKEEAIIGFLRMLSQ